MFNDVKHLDGFVQRSGLSILVNDQVNVPENELAKLGIKGSENGPLKTDTTK